VCYVVFSSRPIDNIYNQIRRGKCKWQAACISTCNVPVAAIGRDSLCRVKGREDFNARSRNGSSGVVQNVESIN
jgi:hypothetical protein